jgi:hypothetical protein
MPPAGQAPIGEAPKGKPDAALVTAAKAPVAGRTALGAGVESSTPKYEVGGTINGRKILGTSMYLDPTERQGYIDWAASQDKIPVFKGEGSREMSKAVLARQQELSDASNPSAKQKYFAGIDLDMYDNGAANWAANRALGFWRPFARGTSNSWSKLRQGDYLGAATAQMKETPAALRNLALAAAPVYGWSALGAPSALGAKAVTAAGGGKILAGVGGLAADGLAWGAGEKALAGISMLDAHNADPYNKEIYDKSEAAQRIRDSATAFEDRDATTQMLHGGSVTPDISAGVLNRFGPHAEMAVGQTPNYQNRWWAPQPAAPDGRYFNNSGMVGNFLNSVYPGAMQMLAGVQPTPTYQSGNYTPVQSQEVFPGQFGSRY